MIRNKFNGYGADGRRQYHKGGDGGAGEARRQEAERQARISAAVGTINDIFDAKPYRKFGAKATSLAPGATYYDELGNQHTVPHSPGASDYFENDASATGVLGTLFPNVQYASKMAPLNELLNQGRLYTNMSVSGPVTKSRDELYNEQKQAVYDINKRDVERQYQEAERATRFGLARSGLLGGSEDVDANARLQEINNEGLMKATGIADQAAADLKTADERARQSLISMAQSGIDTGTAQTMALRNLDATAQSAAGARQGASIGNLFGDLSQAYLLRQQRAGMQAGAGNGYQQHSVSSPQQTYSGSTN